MTALDLLHSTLHHLFIGPTEKLTVLDTFIVNQNYEM